MSNELMQNKKYLKKNLRLKWTKDTMLNKNEMKD